MAKDTAPAPVPDPASDFAADPTPAPNLALAPAPAPDLAPAPNISLSPYPNLVSAPDLTLAPDLAPAPAPAPDLCFVLLLTLVLPRLRIPIMKDTAKWDQEPLGKPQQVRR